MSTFSKGEVWFNELADHILLPFSVVIKTMELVKWEIRRKILESFMNISRTLT